MHVSSTKKKLPRTCNNTTFGLNFVLRINNLAVLSAELLTSGQDAVVKSIRCSPLAIMAGIKLGKNHDDNSVVMF